jgi:hypothetical protein
MDESAEVISTLEHDWLGTGSLLWVRNTSIARRALT